MTLYQILREESLHYKHSCLIKAVVTLVRYDNPITTFSLKDERKQ
jgi:hypothetical protein